MEDNLVFYDSSEAEYFPISGVLHMDRIGDSNVDDLVEGCYYIVMNHVFIYSGNVSSLSEIRSGGLYYANMELQLRPYHSEDLRERFSTENVCSAEDKDKHYQLDINKIIGEYVDSYDRKENIMSNGKIIITTGSKFIPTMDEKDEVLRSLCKEIAIVKQVNLSEISVQDMEDGNKKHNITNITSSIKGSSTKYTSITTFQQWCDYLKVGWKMALYYITENGPDEFVRVSSDYFTPHETPEDIKKSGKVIVPKECITDDPLKRLIKIALVTNPTTRKQCIDKGISSNKVSYMVTSLNDNTRMSIEYFIKWCNLLDVYWSIAIIDGDDRYERNNID